MRRVVSIGLALTVLVVIGLPGLGGEAHAQVRVVSERTATGFKFPESVAYDPQAKVLYVSEFGSELKPAEKDGKGRISRVSLAWNPTISTVAKTARNRMPLENASRSPRVCSCRGR